MKKQSATDDRRLRRVGGKGSRETQKVAVRKRRLPSSKRSIACSLAKEIDIVESGVNRRVSVFEAILLRVWAKEMEGSKRAAAVRMQYQELVPKPTEPRGIIIREVDEDE